MKPSEQLSALNITLPPVAQPVGSYVPALTAGNIVMTSGQLPTEAGQLTAIGKVPSDVPLEQAQQAARLAALNALAAAAHAAGGIDNITQILSLAVFVNSAPGFYDQAKVANGASDFLAQIFGENGRHTRAAVGVAELPLNAAVELTLTARIKP